MSKLKLIDVNKYYGEGISRVHVLKDVSFSAKAGELNLILGPSGSGKSTFLTIAGGLQTPTSGKVLIDGIDIEKLSSKKRDELRLQKIGFILQESALINSLTIEDNIKLPLLYAGSEKKEFEIEDFKSVVDAIGIKPILKKKPLECSGGEKARAVFARGIIMKPQIILADEPTASLDMENRERIVTLLFKMNKEFNTTIITVTHDLEIANRHDRIIQLERSK